MRLNAIITAIVLTGVAGVASAAGQSPMMPTVTVQAAGVSACTPPNDTTGHACDSYNQFLHANFSAREIGMLFGSRTSYPEYMTGGIDRLQKRYDVQLRQYLAAQAKVDADAAVATR